MNEWLAPLAACSFWAGLLTWTLVQRWASPWVFLPLGLVAIASGMFAAPRRVRRPGVIQRSGLLAGSESEAVTSVASDRVVGGRGPPIVSVGLVLLGVASIGMGWAGMREIRLDSTLMSSVVPQHLVGIGSVREDPAPGLYGWSTVVDLARVEWDEARVAVNEAVLAEGPDRPPAIVRGDRVRIEGFAAPPDAGEFANGLRSRGIVAILRVDSWERLGPSANPLVRAGQGFRAFVGASIHRLFPEREAGLLMGLALGDDSALEPELERDFRATGLGHLLVVSGENVAMVLAPMLAIASLLRMPALVRFVVGIGSVVFFVLVTGAEPSVLRAGVMTGLSLVGVVTGRPRSTASILGAAVLILLILDPSLVSSIGFQLSVAATAGMLSLAGPIAGRLRLLPRPVSLAAGTTLAAQIGVTPLLLFHFREVPGTTVLANVIAFPAVAPALLLGLAAAGAGLVWLPLGRVLAAVAMVPLRVLETVADRLAQAPIPWITSDGGIEVLVIGGCVVALVVWRLRTGRRLPRSAVAAGALLVPVFVWAAALSAGPPAGLSITFFDVGQGDAALVSSPAGANVLIDGGPDPDEVAAMLSARGVRRLDLVVASHPHADHVVGLPSVLSRFPVGLVLEPGCPDESSIRRDLLAAIEEANAQTQHPRAGDSLVVGDLRFDVLSPGACFNGIESDANNDALVLRLTYREDTVLFATEPEEPAQRAMLDAGDPLGAQILKVPHHGAATSLPEFFDAVDPQIAIVSVGENPYGHPVPETLDAIAETGARVWRTDEHGSITLSFDGPGSPLVATER